MWIAAWSFLQIDIAVVGINSPAKDKYNLSGSPMTQVKPAPEYHPDMEAPFKTGRDSSPESGL